MQAAPRRTLDPAGAGGVLLLGIVVGVGLGALLGWLAGHTGIGILVGAFLAVPGGILAVYRRYRGRSMLSALFSTPRPVPGRVLPALGGGLVILLALPIFLLAGWALAGWALAAVPGRRCSRSICC